ncbi:MAG TPA: STAS domain-containing protein [Actinomycetota bacterium]|nr:STAS domain-containing protein [Actinomycetota bacterium]
MSNAPVFARYLRDLVDNDRQDLELDLSGVGFMDSSGVAVLLDVCRQMEEVGLRFSLVASSSPVTRVIEAVGLGEVLGTGPGQPKLHMVLDLAEPA